MSQARAGLLRDLGHIPNRTESVLVNRAALLSLQLAALDLRCAQDGGAMGESETGTYVALAMQERMTLHALGLLDAADGRLGR